MPGFLLKYLFQQVIQSNFCLLLFSIKNVSSVFDVDQQFGHPLIPQSLETDALLSRKYYHDVGPLAHYVLLRHFPPCFLLVVHLLLHCLLLSVHFVLCLLLLFLHFLLWFLLLRCVLDVLVQCWLRILLCCLLLVHSLHLQMDLVMSPWIWQLPFLILSSSFCQDRTLLMGFWLAACYLSVTGDSFIREMLQNSLREKIQIRKIKFI